MHVYIFISAGIFAFFVNVDSCNASCSYNFPEIELPLVLISSHHSVL